MPSPAPSCGRNITPLQPILPLLPFYSQNSHDVVNADTESAPYLFSAKRERKKGKKKNSTLKQIMGVIGANNTYFITIIQITPGTNSATVHVENKHALFIYTQECARIGYRKIFS